MSVRALSWWQPWASFVAVGLKTIETRGRLTHVRGRFAVHAAARKYIDALADLLAKSGVNPREWGLDEELPLGAIVAVATLEDCVPVDARHSRLIGMQYHESCFGNYSAGRFAWLLRDVVRLKVPIPCRGRQGWFYLPPDAEAELARTGVSMKSA